MIFNFSKYSRISNSYDGREYDQFKGYEDIEKQMRLFKLKIMMRYI